MTADELFNVLKEYNSIHNEFPNVTEFAKYTELPVDIINKVYKRWYNQGKLVKRGNLYDFYKEDPHKLFSEEKKNEPDNLIIQKDANLNNEKKNNTDYKKLFIKSISGLIGIILVLCSIHFTFDFNRFSMKLFWAFSLSLSIVSFMSIAFTLASYFSEKLFKIIILILWLLGFSYSVFTAVSGQYNDFRKYLSNDKTTMISNKKTLINNQLNIQLKKQKELLHWRELETTYTYNPDLKMENPGTWKSIRNGIESLESCEAKIEELQNQLLDINDMSLTDDETVYSWLSQTLKISSNKLHLIIVSFPAIFIDLCSSICLMFALRKEK